MKKNISGEGYDFNKAMRECVIEKSGFCNIGILP